MAYPRHGGDQLVVSGRKDQRSNCNIIKHVDRRKTIGMDAAAESGAAVMNGPLGDEDLATNVMLISCETEELEEAYKILMLTTTCEIMVAVCVG